MMHINSWRFRSEKQHDFFILRFTAEEFKIFITYPNLQGIILIKYFIRSVNRMISEKNIEVNRNVTEKTPQTENQPKKPS